MEYTYSDSEDRIPSYDEYDEDEEDMVADEEKDAEEEENGEEGFDADDDLQDPNGGVFVDRFRQNAWLVRVIPIYQGICTSVIMVY